MLDDTAAQVILAIESGDSIRRVVQPHPSRQRDRRPTGSKKQICPLRHGLFVANKHVRDAVRKPILWEGHWRIRVQNS